MIKRRSLLAAALALPLLACATSLPDTARADSRLEQIERRTGGRLGVALLDPAGRLVLANRADERFAMCSTFKLPLAGMVLAGVDAGRWTLSDQLAIGRGDIVSHSPLSEPFVGAGRMPLEQAAAAIVTHSDNAAANLILRHTGGPAGLTAWLRSQSDSATRLDRFELEMNENAVGDPRDTTTPGAIAATTRRLLSGTALSPASRDLLRRWTIATETGLRRIRAGLPRGWPAGDKTGSCGTAYNDVAWFRAPSGGEYVLAVYLDRPTVGGDEAQAAIADVARVAAELAR